MPKSQLIDPAVVRKSGFVKIKDIPLYGHVSGQIFTSGEMLRRSRCGV